MAVHFSVGDSMMFYIQKRMQLCILSCSLFFAWILPVPGSAQPNPLDDDFQVNTYTTSRQAYPAVAVTSDGGFIVAWESDGSVGDDQDGSSIQGRRYASDGTPAIPQFQINSYVTSHQEVPAAAVMVDGRIIVAWESRGSPGNDNSSYSVQSRLYSANGLPLNDQFQVNTYTTSFQAVPAVAGANGFVVVWESNGSFGTDNVRTSIQGQIYTPDGVPVGSQFQVNTSGHNSQTDPGVAMGPGGEFVVVWRSDEAGFQFQSIQGRHFASDGTPMGDQFKINTPAEVPQEFPAVAMNSQGGFAVAWRSGFFGGIPGTLSNTEIKVRFFDRGGVALGNDVQVNTITYGPQDSAAVAAGPEGQFLVVWSSPAPMVDTFVSTIQGRRYASDGTPSTPDEFQVNTATAYFHIFPAAAASPQGQFVVTWESGGPNDMDDSSTSIQARRFRLPVSVTAIPTLGAWGLLALAAVLALLALVRLRESTSSRRPPGR